MPKPQKKKTDPRLSEVLLLAWLASCVSVIAFLWYFKNGDATLYGDAVAHVNIARRVFDSKTPGPLQLGTVWLPLPHLLMIPFLISMNMWQTGAGGSLPSMVAYVFGVVGIFRLTRDALSRSAEPEMRARIAAWIAALIYAANPNLIYMQSTAMGEVVYLALFVWAVVYFAQAVRGDSKALTKCGLCLAAACLTRYDGWFLAAIMTACIVVRALLSSSRPQNSQASQWPRASVVRFTLIAAAAPALWLTYNGIVYRNPLEFENGPYSAKGIERKTQSAGNPGHPGSGLPVSASMYFLKSAEDNMAESQWLQRGWLLGIAIALLLAAKTLRTRANAHPQWPFLLLLVPIPFYALSVAYSGVPIFIPQWWPFSHYNVRYGLQLLPAFCVALGSLVFPVIQWSKHDRWLRLGRTLAIFALIIASYATVWHATPICLREAQINMRTRNQLEAQLSGWLSKLPPDSTLLMYLGDHVGAVQRAGIPLKRTINEGNHRTWKQPVDPDGLWERALANPAQYADFILAFEGDPVWQAVQNRKLLELVEVHVTGQARAVLYRAR